MTKSELLRHMAANLDAGLNICSGLLANGAPGSNAYVTIDSMLDRAHCFSIAPRTRVINGFTVPSPMEKEPMPGQVYFCESSANPLWSGVMLTWDGDESDRHRFAIGIHSTSEAAAANCRARHGIDPKWGGE